MAHDHIARVYRLILQADYLGTQNDKASSPITGSWFRIEKGPEATPPKYKYDEIGVVIEGELVSRNAIYGSLTKSRRIQFERCHWPENNSSRWGYLLFPTWQYYNVLF